MDMGAGLGIIITVVSILFTLVVMAGVGFVMWKVFGGLMKQSQERSRILTTGIPATGRVLQLMDTGMLVNNQPQVRIIVEVQMPGRPPYQADTTMILSMLAVPRVQPGCMVHMKVDPMNPANVALMI
ncbi:MAG: hypothetical protein IT377_21645 [Polyangiaceae bacterium]|nr:hypothetical protein [Myxococcales bacterium]MCC6901590.1 hypothetical protein [Polyangiaceae bacterium]